MGVINLGWLIKKLKNKAQETATPAARPSQSTFLTMRGFMQQRVPAVSSSITA